MCSLNFDYFGLRYSCKQSQRLLLGTIHLWRPYGRGWKRVLKFVMCLWILLFLNNSSIVNICGWRGCGESQSW